ncbi:hypothetical protein P154DRAFT_620433 [Amniculicola lignicola CBS 123094]|uniref:Mediator of RNA polymerase II transcription subunit 17 n=1 Tax=Amniculicola lignicola CBS 123094 TaxID=1392246 RepID=A0A6A5WDT2_9PLEO|nr:hypothetical protein P154DRAFT_620433 [Amniculicola lignicola CBS 123094]
MSATGTMATVALRPWPAPKKEKLDHGELLRQIDQAANDRKQHLRFINEELLQDEVQLGKDGPDDIVSGIEAGEQTAKEPTRQERQMEIARVQHEMGSKLEWAAHYAHLALDLVAVVLSRAPGKTVENAFSLQFKAMMVQKGTFGLAVGEKLPRTDEDISRRAMTAKGARMAAADWSVDSILKAAKELNTEIRKETKYWGEILSVSEKGWMVQRLRKDHKYTPFAVRYGFSEAGDHFKARGLAPLHMDGDGSIILDPNLALQPKTLRVRVSRDGKVTGTSLLPSLDDDSSLAIENSIRLARDSLLEEELFQEMLLESRQLIGFSVEQRDSVLHIEAPSLRGDPSSIKILIDCIPRDETHPGAHSSEDRLAQNIAEGLRLLLAHEHSMRLFRRAQPPPPMTQHRRTSSHPPLLRTLLAVFSHISATRSLHKYLGKTAQSLKSARLNVVLECSTETTWEKLSTVIDSSRTLAPMDQLLETFRKPFEGKATMTLPSSKGSTRDRLTIETRTLMGTPMYGTEFKVTLPLSLVTVLELAPDQKREFKFPTVEEAIYYLDWVIALDISHTLLVREYGDRVTTAPESSIVTIAAKEGKSVKRDINVEILEGILHLSSRTLSDGSDSRPVTCSWKDSKTESFRAKVKSLVG